MKFENLPEHVQYLAAETLKSLLVNQGADEKEICRRTAENIRSAFEALFKPEEGKSGNAGCDSGSGI